MFIGLPGRVGDSGDLIFPPKYGAVKGLPGDVGYRGNPGTPGQNGKPCFEVYCNLYGAQTGLIGRSGIPGLPGMKGARVCEASMLFKFY